MTLWSNFMVIKKIVKFSVIWFLLLSSLSHASFEKAMDTYNSGNFVEAKSAFESLASVGDRSALFNLGVMYYRGEAVDSDPVKAYVLMKIANAGFDDVNFKKVSLSLFASLTPAQRKEVEVLYSKLEPVYNIEKVTSEILPKPLDDAHSQPEVAPKKNVSGQYPTSEARAGRMGVTYIELTISPEGYPRDIVVIESTNQAFAKASVTAAKQFIYELPSSAKPVYGHRAAFTYKLDDGRGNEVNVKTEALISELNELKEAANNEDPIAQYKYASQLYTLRFFKDYLDNIDLEYRTVNEWFAKSAANGLPHAQFEIGRNMVEGRGCEVDVVNGYKWINAAAFGGYSLAQKMLAQSQLADDDLPDKTLFEAIGWLRKAATSDNSSAKILLAWELSTSLSTDIRNGDEALSLIASEPDNYFDDIRLFETKAAAYAETGDFKKAIKYQKKAHILASKSEWVIPLISVRLALYESNKPYRGSYY